MPIIEIYSCSKTISKNEFSEIASTISSVLNIDPSLVWFIQHSIDNSNIFKSEFYNINSPIIFFNTRKKHNKSKIIKCLRILSEKIAILSNSNSKQIFCGVRRIVDDEILQPSHE